MPGSPLARLALLAGAGLVALLGAGLGLFYLLLPDHVSVDFHGSSFLRPDDGYIWISPDDRFDWSIQWAPGLPSPVFPNVIASEEPDKWRPAPGYGWTNAEASSREVVWTPGKREPGFPHVTAAVAPGTWYLDPGYGFSPTATPQAPHATWQPGLRDSNRFPHMEAGTKEGYWFLDPGYAWASDSTALNPKVVWMPGTPNWQHPHVLAGATSGNWTLEQGFLWLDPDDNNDLRTFSGVRTVEVWRSMAYIDLTVGNYQCSTAGDLQGVLKTARDSYGSLDAQDVHPLLAQHIRDIYSALDGAYDTLGNCQAVDTGTGLLALGVAAACAFADDWQECMEGSTLRDAGEAVGAVATGVCVNEGRELRARVDELSGERRSLHGLLQSRYGLQLPLATELIACH